MPFWIRIVVLKWMAQVLRFEIPNKRKRITVDQQEQDHTADLLRKKEENLHNNPKVTRETSSLDALSFVPRKGVHALVKKLSSSNLVNGNYNSGPKFPHHDNMGSLPRLTVSQMEDWQIASSHASLSSNEDDDKRHNSEADAGDEVSGHAFDQRCMAEFLKTQGKILEHVQMLCNVVTENEQLQEKKDEWNLVAAIFDRAFRIGFLIMFFLLSLTIFYFSMG